MDEKRTFYDEITGLYFVSSYKKMGEAITMLNLNRMVNRTDPTSLRQWTDILGISAPVCFLKEHRLMFESYEKTNSLLIISFDKTTTMDNMEVVKVRLNLFSI